MKNLIKKVKIILDKDLGELLEIEMNKKGQYQFIFIDATRLREIADYLQHTQ